MKSASETPETVATRPSRSKNLPTSSHNETAPAPQTSRVPGRSAPKQGEELQTLVAVPWAFSLERAWVAHWNDAHA
jgi:hypothetical protein